MKFSQSLFLLGIFNVMICSKCKEDKDCSCFVKSNLRKRGYSSYCKECHKSFRKKDYHKNRKSSIDKARENARNLKNM